MFIVALALVRVRLGNALVVGKVRSHTKQAVIAAVGIEHGVTALGSAVIHDLQIAVFVTHLAVFEILMLRFGKTVAVAV